MKYRFKFLIVIISLLFAGLVLTACNGDDNKQQGYTLPDLTGKTIDNYSQVLNSPLITVVTKLENHDSIPVNQFTRYGNNLTAGSVVNPGITVYVYFSKGPVKVADTEKPVILGADYIEVEYSSVFDPKEGITVTDNVDQDLINRIIVTGTVNTLQFGEQKLTYTVMDRSGNLTSIERTIKIIPATMDTRYTDSLTLNVPYEGKNFLTDGIGVATLYKCIDGDTAHFLVGGEIVPVRFQGINTPESTYKYEPWGKPASHFTCEKLTNANTIVLERENEIFDSTGSRYLAWVWVDGRLLNLEIVENAFSTATGTSGSKYNDIFLAADLKTKGTLRHIWADPKVEPDTEFDYSLVGEQITIEYLRDNSELYYGKKVVIHGIVTRKIGGNAYIEQDGFGVYLYIGFTFTTKLEVGNEVSIQALIPSDYNGLLELSNYNSNNVQVLSTGNQVTPTVITYADIAERYEGAFVQLNNLRITSVQTPDEKGNYSILAQDELGNTINIRHNGEIFPTIPTSKFVVGEYIDVVAPLGQFYDDYQLMLANIYDINFHSDNVVPEISGAANVDVVLGSVFDPMQGVTATDAVYGDLTARITVVGTVDTSIAGAQTITYKVTDGAGNITEVTRTITVITQ